MRVSSLAAGERETTIQWSDADGLAYVFTAQRSLARRLGRIREAALVGTSRGPRGEWWGEEWQVPIKAVIPRNPPRGRPAGVLPPGRRFQKKQTGNLTRQEGQSEHPRGGPGGEGR